MVRRVKQWRILRESVIWLAAALALSCAHAADGDDAANAIAEAEKAVARAKARDALWTSAEEALRQARRALDAGNSTVARDHARIALEQATLGIAQKQYPLTR